MLGAGDWNCPTLVLANDATAAPQAWIKSANGRRFIDNARDIGRHFAQRYGTPVPR